MGDADSDEVWRPAAVAARMLAGWACLAVAALDLSMGVDVRSRPTDRPYLVFHLVLLLGGLLLLGLGRLPGQPRPIGYAVTAALAVVATGLAAVPRTSTVCCTRDLAARHGFPFTMVASDARRPVHVAPAHAVVDLAFWFLVGLLLLALVTTVVPGRTAGPETEPGRATATPPVEPTSTPEVAQVRRATHAEDRAAAPPVGEWAGPDPARADPEPRRADREPGRARPEPGRDRAIGRPGRDPAAGELGPDRAADDENVGGLP